MNDLPVQTVRVTFQETIDWGGIPITITCGQQSVSLIVTDCCDPFPAMLRWLEAITTGVQCCFFDVDEEGKEKRFSLEQDCNHSWFSIVNTYDEEEVFIRAVVDPVQLVQAFYLGLKEYAQSPLYIKQHWHGETLAELLARLTDPPCVEASITASLLCLDREGVRSALSMALPAYDVKFRGIANLDERNHKELFNLFDHSGAKQLKGSKVKPIHWNILDDYDQLPATEKSGYIDKLLRKPLGGASGCDLTEWKSTVIENWLSDKEIDMNKDNEDIADIAAEEVLTALYKLASVGAGKAFSIDLMEAEKLSGVPVDIETVCGLAMLGAANEDDRDLVRSCWSALVPEPKED